MLSVADPPRPITKTNITIAKEKNELGMGNERSLVHN